MTARRARRRARGLRRKQDCRMPSHRRSRQSIGCSVISTMCWANCARWQARSRKPLHQHRTRPPPRSKCRSLHRARSSPRFVQRLPTTPTFRRNGKHQINAPRLPRRRLCRQPHSRDRRRLRQRRRQALVNVNFRPSCRQSKLPVRARPQPPRRTQLHNSGRYRTLLRRRLWPPANRAYRARARPA